MAPMSKIWFSINFNASTRFNPFKVYDRDPLILLRADPQYEKDLDLGELLMEWDQILEQLKVHLYWA